MKNYAMEIHVRRGLTVLNPKPPFTSRKIANINYTETVDLDSKLFQRRFDLKNFLLRHLSLEVTSRLIWIRLKKRKYKKKVSLLLVLKVT